MNKRVLIIVDNLRIGGFQRVALDQAYYLSEAGVNVTLVVLSKFSEINQANAALYYLEVDKFSKIQVVSIGGSNFIEILRLILLMRKHSFTHVLSHSLRGTVELFLARLTLRFKPILITTIHQIPSLSAMSQRVRRLIYAQFTDVLFGYSVAVVNDWNMNINRMNFSLRVIFNKRISLLRNGIYLKRLPERQFAEVNSVPRLVYLGRIRDWKGFDTYLNLSNIPDLQYFKFLIMVPEMSEVLIQDLKERLGSRLELIIGRTFAEYIPTAGDVHIYPTNYGNNFKYIESISLNCLEFACLGIPSLVTEKGLDTWPDLEKIGIFRGVNWKDQNSIKNAILNLSHIEIRDLESLRHSISIKNQMVSLGLLNQTT